MYDPEFTAYDVLPAWAVTVKPPPLMVTLFADTIKQLPVTPVIFCVSVYVPGDDMFPQDVTELPDCVARYVNDTDEVETTFRKSVPFI